MLEKMRSFMKKKVNRNEKRPGFTLVELMVAMSIVILLGAASFFAYGHVQQMRKMAQVSTEMDAIANACLTYESLNVAGALPASLKDLETGLTAANSIDGVKHENLIQASTNKTSGKVTGIKDPWNQDYGYDKTARTISCNPKDASGGSMSQIVKHF